MTHNLTFVLKGSTLAGKMTEGAPIQDPSIPNSVSVPETPRDSFGIEMRYNPEFVYTILNRSNKSRRITLHNNWESIYDSGYDLFSGNSLYKSGPSTGIATSVDSDLKVKSNPNWPDRSSKIFSISTKLKGGFEWESFPRLQTELWSMGLDSDLTHDPRWGFCGKFLISKNLDLPVTIGYWELHEGRYLVSDPDHLVISLPYPSVDLTSSDDIKKSMDLSAGILEKTIRALYKMCNKHLPLQKLIFEPRESESTEKSNLASCTYCGSFYPIVHGLTCPHCGASNPKFS